MTDVVEANYKRVLPDNAGGANMGTLATDRQRMLGDGMCTRPIPLEGSFEPGYEPCIFLET